MTLAWIRPEMERVGVTQRDIARAWGVSESGVSRWLDGLQRGDPPFGRVVILARLLRLPLVEVARRLGHEVPDKLPPPEPVTFAIRVSLSADDCAAVMRTINTNKSVEW